MTSKSVPIQYLLLKLDKTKINIKQKLNNYILRLGL